MLTSWLTKLAPFYEEDSVLRKGMLSRLNMDYWLYQAQHQYEHYIENEVNTAHSKMHNSSGRYHNSTVPNVRSWSGAEIKRSLRGGWHDHSDHHHEGDNLPVRLAIDWNEV